VDSADSSKSSTSMRRSNIASLHPHFTRTKRACIRQYQCRKNWALSRVAYLREALQCSAYLPRESSHSRRICDGCPWHSVLFRVAAHRSSAQSQDPFEIEAE